MALSDFVCERYSRSRSHASDANNTSILKTKTKVSAIMRYINRRFTYLLTYKTDLKTRLSRCFKV